MKKFVVMGFVLAFLVAGSMARAQSFEYVGAAKCKMCHSNAKVGAQYKIWSDSKHAKAMASLSSEKSKEYGRKNNIPDCSKEPKCLKCHSTAASVSKDLWAGITVAEGVSCESCHGPGSAYKTNPIMKDRAKALKNGLIIPDAKTCEKCHNPQNPFHKPFDYKKAVKEIEHPTPKQG